MFSLKIMENKLIKIIGLKYFNCIYLLLAVTHVLHPVDSCLHILGLFLCLILIPIIKCYKVYIPYTSYTYTK